MRVLFGDIDEITPDVINWQDLDFGQKTLYKCNQNLSSESEKEGDEKLEFQKKTQNAACDTKISHNQEIPDKKYQLDFELNQNSNSPKPKTKIELVENTQENISELFGKNVIDDYHDFVIAISGKAFEKFITDRLNLAKAVFGNSVKILDIVENDHVLNLFLRKCIVYARMKPDQKSEAVTYIQDLYKKDRILVGFVGDGANDCGALKTAHIGVSLSMSEASIAAPFTSNITNISSVVL